ncbi:MAG: threonine/serine exporter family protein [Lachnospiraceae bacterium]|nr:threonine/serine exporter family protein [Lachnospiraceae bacterium]
MENATSSRIDYDKVMEAAVTAGVILVRCGSEIKRVEDTVARICRAFGMEVRQQIFSLSNAMMISYDNHEEDVHLSRIIEVPIDRMRINQLIEINQLSRDIAAGRYTLDEALEKIRAVENTPDTPLLLRLLAASVASFAFGLLFQCSLLEAGIAAIGGLGAFFTAAVACRKLSKIISNLAGGMALALIALLAPLLFRGGGIVLDSMKIMLGAMMPLVPGLSFMNGFRDIGNGDYLSGTVRMLDALLVGVSIASGAAIIYKFLSLFGGIV